MIASKSKYKETGLKWITEIPEHWELKRLGGLFEERNETVSENDYAPLSVTMKGIVPQLESAAKTMHVDNRKKVCVGDFAINSRSDRRGSGGLSNLEGSVSIVNTVLKPSKFYVPEYTHYLLTNKLFQDEYYAKGKGIVADMWSTRFSEMKTIYLPVPPKAEQDEIVQYIKAQEEKINLFIQKKQRFIELLKEQRQSIILNTTRAIDKHDKTIRVKYLGRIRSGDGISNENLKDEGEYEVFGGNGFIGYTNTFNVEGENIIIGRVGAKCGNIRLINEKKFISDNALVLTLFEKNNYEYVAMVLEALDLNKLSVSTAQPLITGTKVMNIAIPHLSSEEQKQIVSHIKTETATIDTAIAKAEREIELIREYKEAMIAEAVMGKNL